MQVGTLCLVLLSQVQSHWKSMLFHFCWVPGVHKYRLVNYIWLQNNSFVSGYDTRNSQRVFSGNLFHGFSWRTNEISEVKNLYEVFMTFQYILCIIYRWESRSTSCHTHQYHRGFSFYHIWSFSFFPSFLFSFATVHKILSVLSGDLSSIFSKIDYLIELSRKVNYLHIWQTAQICVEVLLLMHAMFLAISAVCDLCKCWRADSSRYLALCIGKYRGRWYLNVNVYCTARPDSSRYVPVLLFR